MICYTPIWIKKEGNLNKGVEVPCGKCLSCLERRRSIWTFRILNELEVAESAKFLTLTYDEKHLPWIDEKGNIGSLWEREREECLKQAKKLKESICKEDLTKFLKRVRNEIMKNWSTVRESGDELKESDFLRYVKRSEISGKYSPRLRYYGVQEYGEEGNRPHAHIILYNVPIEWYDWDSIKSKWYSDKLERIWNKGQIDVGEVERGSAHYVAKYSLKYLKEEFKPDDIRVRPYAVMSKNPGIGNCYLNEENRAYHINSEIGYTYIKGGYKQAIGRYYKDRIWPEEKPTWKWEMDVEEGKKVQGETSGVRLRNQERERANRRGHDESKRAEQGYSDIVLEEEGGDTIEAERRIRRERIENFKRIIENRKVNEKKGKL